MPKFTVELRREVTSTEYVTREVEAADRFEAQALADAMAADLAKLSAPKLLAVIAQRNAHWRQVLDATLAAHMGHLRHEDIVELAKGSSLLAKTKVAQDYLNARLDWAAAQDELDARMAYQGTARPIRR